MARNKLNLFVGTAFLKVTRTSFSIEFRSFKIFNFWSWYSFFFVYFYLHYNFFRSIPQDLSSLYLKQLPFFWLRFEWFLQTFYFVILQLFSVILSYHFYEHEAKSLFKLSISADFPKSEVWRTMKHLKYHIIKGEVTCKIKKKPSAYSIYLCFCRVNFISTIIIVY